MALAKFVPRPLSQNSVKRDKRSTYAKEYEKLQQQTSNALRDIASTTEQLATALQQDYPDIAESLRHMTGLRFELSHKKNRHAVENRLERLNTNVLRVGEAMKSATTSNQGVEELQALMRKINEDLYEAKVESNTESSKLTMEESQLAHELKILHKDIDGWTKWGTASEEHECPHSMQSIKEINSTKPDAVVKFEEFCATHGGMTDGWEHLDHNEFLAFRLQRGPLTEKLAEEASSIIPTKSPVEIFRHEEWYRKFQNLVEAKKEAVSGWKRTKCQQQKEAAELASQKAKFENERNAETAKLENEKKKLLVEADKAEKRKMEEQKSAEAAKKMAEQSEKARQRFLEHQNLLKSRLDDHYEKVHQRFSKIQMEEEAKLEELKQRRLQATLQVTELATKEITKAKNELSKKKHFSLEKAAVQARRKRLAEQLREKAAKNVKADPERLNQHTEAWNHRLDAKFSESTANESGDHVLRNWEAQLDIFNSPKLKLPDWRTQAN